MSQHSQISSPIRLEILVYSYGAREPQAWFVNLQKEIMTLSCPSILGKPLLDNVKDIRALNIKQIEEHILPFAFNREA